MTPLQQELHNLKCKCEQQIRMDEDEIKQAQKLIERCEQRIKRNEEVLR